MTDSIVKSPAVGSGAMSARRGTHEPIVPGFYPDPTICRAGDEYFLAMSSFEYFPAAPLFHSHDLLSWRQIGNVLDRRTQFRMGLGGDSAGIYGSTLRYHEGVFWFITTNVSDFDSGQVIVTSADPGAGWSEPIFVPQAIGIDPDLAWGDDGTCYLTWNALNFTDGGKGIRQAILDPSTGELLGADYAVWQGTGMVAPEGPHLYHIADYWYLLLAEGGTERGHSVTIARSTSPAGPFEPCPWNPVFTHRSTGHPVQNVGHADLIQAPDGSWAAVYLGARPKGSTPGFHVLGRETFLAGVDWLDGWPVFDDERFSPPRPATGFVDTFQSSELDHRWVVPSGSPAAFTERMTGGGLRLSERGDGPLCFRVRDFSWSASAKFDDSGRFQLRIDSRHWCGLELHNGQVKAIACIGGMERVLDIARVPAGPNSLMIKSVPATSPTVPFGHAGPDEIILGLEGREGFVELERLDGRYFSTEVAAGFTGRVLGVSPVKGDTYLHEVRYEPSD